MGMPMRNSTSGPASAGAVLAASGATAGVVHGLWIAVACLVIGGTLFTLAKLGPRVAVEPVRRSDGGHRLWLTVNGRPVGRRRG